MRKIIFLMVASSLVLLAVAAPAQVCMSLDAVNPGIMDRSYLPSSAFPGGAPEMIGPFPLVSAAALPPVFPPAGGMACDQTTSTIYTTDGFVVTMDVNPIYLPLSSLPLPFPTPPAPMIPPAPAPGFPPFGPITGLAVDVAAGVLWASDPQSFVAYPLAPPFVPLMPAAIPIPGVFLGGPPVSGLGFESSTGSLWACDMAGAIYNFLPFGAPIGPQPVAFVPFAAAPLSGLAVNTSNGPGSFAPPACSPQFPGHHIEVTDGLMVYDALAPAPPIPLIVGPSGLGAYGLCYSSDFQITLGAAACSTGLAGYLPGTVMENFVGAGAFNGLTVNLGPPLATIGCLVDLCVIPGGGLPTPSGDILHISPFTSSFVMGFALTDAAGKATIPLSFVPLPAGVQVSFQWAFPDPGLPLGVCLTDAVTLTTGLP